MFVHMVNFINLKLEKALRENDNRGLSPKDLCEIAMKSTDAEEATSAMIIFMMKDEEGYAVNYYRANLDFLETLGLLEFAKDDFLKGS